MVCLEITTTFLIISNYFQHFTSVFCVFKTTHLAISYALLPDVLKLTRTVGDIMDNVFVMMIVHINGARKPR